MGDQAIVPVMCSDASPSVIDTCAANGDRGCEYKNTMISSKTGLFGWGVPSNESIAVDFYHHVVDGEQQDGLWVGAKNVTSWAIKHYGPDSHNTAPYWLVRWLGAGEKLQEGEFKTFLKVGYF